MSTPRMIILTYRKMMSFEGTTGRIPINTISREELISLENSKLPMAFVLNTRCIPIKICSRYSSFCYLIFRKNTGSDDRGENCPSVQCRFSIPIRSSSTKLGNRGDGHPKPLKYNFIAQLRPRIRLNCLVSWLKPEN